MTASSRPRSCAASWPPDPPETGRGSLPRSRTIGAARAPDAPTPAPPRCDPVLTGIDRACRPLPPRDERTPTPRRKVAGEGAAGRGALFRVLSLVGRKGVPSGIGGSGGAPETMSAAGNFRSQEERSPDTGEVDGSIPSKPTTTYLGWLAQLVERLVYTENVGGSSPSPPTIMSSEPLS